MWLETSWAGLGIGLREGNGPSAPARSTRASGRVRGGRRPRVTARRCAGRSGAAVRAVRAVLTRTLAACPRLPMLFLDLLTWTLSLTCGPRHLSPRSPWRAWCGLRWLAIKSDVQLLSPCLPSYVSLCVSLRLPLSPYAFRCVWLGGSDGSTVFFHTSSLRVCCALSLLASPRPLPPLVCVPFFLLCLSLSPFMSLSSFVCHVLQVGRGRTGSCHSPFTGAELKVFHNGPETNGPETAPSKCCPSRKCTVQLAKSVAQRSGNRPFKMLPFKEMHCPASLKCCTTVRKPPLQNVALQGNALSS